MDYIPQADATNGYPTRDGFFPRISLFESDLASLRAEAASAVNKTLEKFLEWRQEKRAYLVECPPWKLYNEHRGLYQYKRLYERHPNIVGSRIFGAIEGNYRDVARFFKTETREEYFNAQKILFPSTVDAAVLHTFPPREGEGSPLSYEGIKWVACDPFLLRFRMDSCHYETMGEGVDPDGKPYVYRCILSVDLPQIRESFKAKRTVRIALRNIMVIQPSDSNPNASKIFMRLQCDFKGHRAPRSLFKQYLVRLQSLGSALQTRKTVYTLKNEKWVASKAKGDYCSVCSRSFSLFRAKAQCPNCVTIVCKKCLVKSSEVFGVLPSHKTKGGSSCKLCTTCVVQLRQRYEEKQSSPVLEGSVLWNEDIEACIWSGRPSLHEQWADSPVDTKKTKKEKKTRRRLGTATSIEDEILSTPGSCASSTSDLDYTQSLSPAVDLEKLTYSLRSDVIKEDETERSSLCSVELIIDTSEMARACGWRNATSFQPSSTARGSELFESIYSSLRVQGILLRQMQQHTPISRNV